MEARLKTAAEREAHARNLLRLELVGRAANNDVEGVRELLLRSRDEAVTEKTNPRVSAESRNDLGN